MIKITLTTIMPLESRISKQKIIAIRCIFFFISFVYITILNGYYLILYFKPDVEKDYILSPLFIGARIFKVSMDFCIEILFITLLVFFIKYRREHGVIHTFSFNNYIVLITILLLYSLCVFQSVLIFVWTFD